MEGNNSPTFLTFKYTVSIAFLPTVNSSSLARQPYVSPDLPQKLLPAEVSAIVSSDFVTSVFSRVGLSASLTNPAILEGQCFLSGLSPLAD
jgi:hypothetical protein